MDILVLRVVVYRGLVRRRRALVLVRLVSERLCVRLAVEEVGWPLVDVEVVVGEEVVVVAVVAVEVEGWDLS